MGKPRDGFINNSAIKADIVFHTRHPDSFASPSGSKVLGDMTSDEVMSLTAQGLEGYAVCFECDLHIFIAAS